MAASLAISLPPGMADEIAVRTLLLLLIIGISLQAADIDGTIVIKHKLTKRKVTATTAGYDRGAVVPLTPEKIENPLSFERRHVVIYLDGSFPAPPATATLEQKNRQFSPDMIVVPVGSMVSFPNLDPIFHNVFSLSKPKSFDLGNYPNGQTKTVSFNKPGIVMVNCHLHTNMGAVIVVTPNQFATRADQDGHFVLRNLPAGRQTIVAWHKAAGFFRQTIEVGEGHTATVEFGIPLSESGELISSNATSAVSNSAVSK